ncbi:hypothetical protein PMZ80_007013 [Knufia obscura]|uniref:CCHC-type domain-containing protein n=1 Tax=Knufia obscura TaxID=1635080 RepID=A0ABR0RJ16_9EURO|nr:hypothetical protein PMZ80_007013 [Knufia obscura]
MGRSKNRSKRKGSAIDTPGESRTAAVGKRGRKRSLAPASNAETRNSQEPARKRRKASLKDNRKPGNTVGTENLRDFVPFSSLHNTDFAQGQQSSMPVQNFGNNRLRSGFLDARRIQRSASHPGTPSDSGDDPNSPAPVVYDLDTEDEDGGITLNVQGNDSVPIVISDDDETEEEEGQINESSDLEEGQEREDVQPTTGGDSMQVDWLTERPTADDVETRFAAESTLSKAQVYLKDLNPDQLEDQIKYAFWQLQRDQIDLSRPARCLHCQAEGHIDEKCPQKTCMHCGSFGAHDSALCPRVKRCDTCRQPGHESCNGMRNTTIPCDLCSLAGHSENICPLRHYPRAAASSTEPLRLWVTCSACASKSHLVGDCSRSVSSKAPRWSLKSLDPDHIVNLSTQSGMEQLEREAQNRGMRPEGLKIRGRANQHQADSRRHDLRNSDSDDLENFLSHPPRTRIDRRNAPPVPPPQDPYHYRPGDNTRYDRYAAPSGSDSYRPPRNDFYATDSFGRRRSRSPPTLGRYALDRSPSPDSYNSYRPGNYSHPRRSPPPSRSNIPSRALQHLPRPAPGLSIQLPTRKSSNTSTNGAASAANANLPPKPTFATNVNPTDTRQKNGNKKPRPRPKKANKK